MGTNFQYSKTLTCEGSILMCLAIVPYVGWVLGIIGIILLMKGIKELAIYYQDNSIYQNSLTGVKYYIVALIAAGVASAGIVVGIASSIGIGSFTTGFGTVGLAAGIAVFIGAVVIAFIFYIVAASHLRKTFDTLAQKSGEQNFATAGTLLWWGSVFTILVVGLLLILVAWIFAVIGFFTMKPQPNTSPLYSPPPTQPTIQPQQPTRYCSYCGAPVLADSAYCSHCGKQLQP
jgi:uncharacterized membrane protein